MNIDVKNKSILVVDDEVEICSMLVKALNKEGFNRVYKAHTGTEAVKINEDKNPDLVVLDIMLPDIEGYDVCREIRKSSNKPILFLSARTEEMDRILGFAIGGDDYVTKPFSPREVCYRVKAQLRRSYPESKDTNSIMSIGPFQVNEDGMEVFKNNENLNLKPKELKLFLYFIKNKNRILSKEQICDYVWGEDYMGFDNTIMVHIRRLREKIERNPSKPEYIINIKGLGYKFTIPGE